MASYIRRREFLATLLSGAAAGWPLVARAQQPGKLPTIGYLGTTTASAWGPWQVLAHNCPGLTAWYRPSDGSVVSIA